jgi:class 3 adenylate cyclase
MPALDYRLKLLLAMMVVVVGVTGATLAVARHRLAAAQRRFFEQQFYSQRALLDAQQAGRLRGHQAKCASFSRLVRLQTLLRRWNTEGEENEQANLAATAELLYQNAEDLFQEALNPSKAEPGAPLASWFRLLGQDGKVIPPPRGIDAGRLRSEGEQRLATQLAGIFASQAPRAGAGVGYLAADNRRAQRRLFEVIFTPVIDPRDQGLLGALAVGFPAPESSPLSNFQAPVSAAEAAVPGGVWLAGELFSAAIPEAVRPLLAAWIGEALQHSGSSEGRLDLAVEGTPYRALFADAHRGSPFPRACRVSLFSLQEALSEQRALRWTIVGYGALALAAAMGLSWLLAHGLSVPIRELVAGTGEIQRGRYEIKVPVRSRDELGRLAASFNDMAAGLALKEKYRSVLNLVADAKVADELMRGQVALGGEQRDVSVLFCDIRGFTALTQNMPPTEVVRMLNEHFTPLTRVVYEFHGVVDKFVGDLIMAVFGAPKSTGQDAWNAALCARRMIEARAALNQTSSYQIQVGIGVASGPALAGCMGSKDRLSYTVLGERVNLASRLCSQAGRMEVVIDATTRAQLGAAAQVAELPPLKLKGFSEPVAAYKLTGIQLPVTGTTTAPETRAPSLQPV